MTDLYERIVQDRGKLRDWMDRVPGLRGYMDRNDRREADNLLRKYIGEQLEQRLDRYVGLEKRLVKRDGMTAAANTREAKMKFQTYIDKVKTAAAGYSSYFSAVNIDERALERVYAFDEAQIRYVGMFDERIDALENAIDTDDNPNSEIQAIYDLAQEAMQAFALRDDILTQLNKEYSESN